MYLVSVMSRQQKGPSDQDGPVAGGRFVRGWRLTPAARANERPVSFLNFLAFAICCLDRFFGDRGNSSKQGANNSFHG